MKTIICHIPEGHGKEGIEEYDWGIIQYLFKRTVIITSDNEAVLEWFMAGVNSDFNNLFFYTTIPNDELFNLKWEHYSETYKSNKTSDFWSNIGAQAPSQKAIAIIDTGIADHPDLNANRVFININDLQVWGVTFNSKGTTYHYSITDNTQYVHPHGTHVAGIAAGIGNNGIGIAGVYWRNKIFSINVFEFVNTIFGRQLGAYSSSILNGLNFVASHPEIFRCVNMSLGGGYSEAFENALIDAFEAMAEQEQFVICAAGNSHHDISVSRDLPAAVRTINNFAIGSSNVNGLRSWFSNYSSIFVPCLIAGGSAIKSQTEGKYCDDDILSTIPADENSPVYNIIETANGKYGYMAGTSMASPFACGLMNKVFELLKSQYSGASFKTLCELMNMVLEGATYNHIVDLFDYSVSGGIMDLSLIKPGNLVAPKIISVVFEDEILKINVKNETASSRIVYCSLGAGMFIDPSHNGDPNKISSAMHVIGAGKTYTFEFNILNYYAYEKIGILACFISGGSLYGLYRKARVYNPIECPTSPCQDIRFRCSDYDFPPLKIKNYAMLSAGLLGTLASRVQVRLLFFYNSQRDIDGTYHTFVPVSTNGLCLNTVNHIYAQPQFQVACDATQNDMLLAIMSMYKQMREVYDEGIIYNGRMWYVLDYSHYKSEGEIRRKQLPEEFDFDDGEIRLDLIGKIADAIEYMIFNSKVLFSVANNVYKYSELLSSYTELFEPDLDEVLSKFAVGSSYNLPIINISMPAPEPNTYWDSDNKEHYRMQCPYCTDPYTDKYPDVHTCWVLYWDGMLTHYTNDIADENISMKIISTTPDEGPVDVFHAVTQTGMRPLLQFVIDDTYSVEKTVAYNFRNLPLSLHIANAVEPEMYDPQYDSSKLSLVEDFNISGGVYLDTCPKRETGGKFPMLVIKLSDSKYQAVDRLPYIPGETEPEKPGYAGTGRLIKGERTFLKTVLPNCPSINISIPLAFEIKFNMRMDSHYDTNRMFDPSYFDPGTINWPKNNSFDYPTGQPLNMAFTIKITKVKTDSSEVIFQKTFTIFNYSEFSKKEIRQWLTIDFNQLTDKYLIIDVAPDYGVLLNNPTHNLIVFKLGDGNATVMIPPVSPLYLLAKDYNEFGHPYKVFATTTHEGTSYDFVGFGLYTRSTGGTIGIDLVNPAIGFKKRYYDVRGIPEAVVDSVCANLGMVCGNLGDTQKYLKLKSCGWWHVTGIPENEYFVVDQLPSHYYPHLFENDSNMANVYLAISKLITEKPKYSIPKQMKKLEYNIGTTNRFHSRLIQKFYELDETENTEFNFIPTINGANQITPDIIGFTEEEISDFIHDNYEVVNYLFHPSPDGTVKYQFPRAKMCAGFNKIIACIPDSSDMNDYEMLVIPSLTFLKPEQIPEKLLEKFNLVKIGTAPSFCDGKIVFQFPPAGVNFIRKSETKHNLYYLVGNKSYSSVARVYNINL